MSRTLLDELMKKHKPNPEGAWDDDKVAQLATEYAQKMLGDSYMQLSVEALLLEDDDEDLPIDEIY